MKTEAYCDYQTLSINNNNVNLKIPCDLKNPDVL